MLERMRTLWVQAHRSAVAWSLATTVLRVGTLIFILPLVLRILPPEELGLWYVFLSVSALTGLLDFGFSPTMTRAIGYVWGGAKVLKAMGLHADDAPEELSGAPNYPLLMKLIASMAFYYRLLAIAILLVMLTAGSWWIWLKTENLPHQTMLRAGWIFFSFGTALNALGNLWPALLSGINGVRQAQQLSLVSLLANYFCVVVGLLCHLSIWALIIGQILTGIILRQGGKLCFAALAKIDLKTIPSQADPELLKTLWPMSWRNGLVSISGFALLNANTLVCSAYLGLAETASYGLSMQVINFVASLSTIGVQVKFPEFNQLRAQNRLGAIARIFISRMRLMLFVYLVGALAILFFGEKLLFLIHARTHFIPTPIFTLLLIFYFLEIHNHQYGTLIVSENTMPVLIPFIVTGAGVVLLSLVLTPLYGLWGMVLSFGLVSLCFNDWWVVWRGIHGLKMKSLDYWKLFFGLEKA